MKRSDFSISSSAVKDQGRKIHYYDFLMSKKSEDCNKALMRIVPRIHMDEIQNFLQEVPYLSDLQHTFYQTYIQARWEKLLMPAYEQLIG